jgi:cytochrome c peroxidase
MGLGRDTTPGDDIGWGEHGGTAWAFRTAPLRHVAESSPYLHAGTAETLADVIRFKNNGRSEHNRVPDSRLDAAMRPLGLTEAEMGRLVAFLESLSDAGALKGLLFQPPASVPSGLEIPQ